jgi:hypothetical protein
MACLDEKKEQLLVTRTNGVTLFCHIFSVSSSAALAMITTLAFIVVKSNIVVIDLALGWPAADTGFGSQPSC